MLTRALSEKRPSATVSRYRNEQGGIRIITENPYGGSLIREIRPSRTMFCRPDRGGYADGFARTLRVQPLILHMEDVQPAGERKSMEQDPEEREENEQCHGTAQNEHGRGTDRG